MRAVKQTVRKYYKYQTTTRAFIRPNLGADGTLGGNSFACSAKSVMTIFRTMSAYKAFDSYTGYENAWGSQQYDASAQWFIFYNPNPINVTSLTFNQTGIEPNIYYPRAITIEGSNDNSTWTNILNWTGSVGGQTSYTISLSSNTEYYKYYKLTCTDRSYWSDEYTQWMIGELSITAQERIIEIVEGTAQDYDFYKDVDEYKAPRETVRHYYKYVYTDATSPVFASENQAVSGINNFKMTTTTSYWYITGNSTNTFTNGNTLTFDIGENNKNIKSIGYIGVVSPGNYPGTVLKNIQCSEDNQNWITISSRFGGRGDYKTNPLQITTPNNYRYIRFTTACDDGDYSRGGAYGLQIKYDARGYQESTSSDYDFYKDVNTYYGVQQ